MRFIHSLKHLIRNIKMKSDIEHFLVEYCPGWGLDVGIFVVAENFGGSNSYERVPFVITKQ